MDDAGLANTELSPTQQPDDWPGIPLESWKDSYATLHMWTQIVGKIRLSLAPWVNHSWHTTLYTTARGLTTSPMPYGARAFQIDFDFIAHKLLIQTSDGVVKTMVLQARSVADFYRELLAHLKQLDIGISIHTTPNEVVEAIPFESDEVHAAYDPESVNRVWRALLQADRLLKQFRGRFIGKCSPVHFFWGSFDLAVTRFSGRTAPMHPGGVPHCPDRIMCEAYSHELSSCGFWHGNDLLPYPAFYAYAYPMPQGFGTALNGAGHAFYEDALGEFILPYEAVRQAPLPDTMVLEFLQRSYEAAANLGGWNRAALEPAVQW